MIFSKILFSLIALLSLAIVNCGDSGTEPNSEQSSTTQNSSSADSNSSAVEVSSSAIYPGGENDTNAAIFTDYESVLWTYSEGTIAINPPSGWDALHAQLMVDETTPIDSKYHNASNYQIVISTTMQAQNPLSIPVQFAQVGAYVEIQDEEQNTEKVLLTYAPMSISASQSQSSGRPSSPTLITGAQPALFKTLLNALLEQTNIQAVIYHANTAQFSGEYKLMPTGSPEPLTLAPTITSDKLEFMQKLAPMLEY
jgi:hypothetical protein